MTAIAVALGIDSEVASKPAEEAVREAREEAAKKEADVKPATTQQEPEPATATEEVDPEELEKQNAKKNADEEKLEGNKLYKARKFDEAIEHYNKAWELHKDITYLNNRAAAEFEKGDYNAAIESCKEAVEHGREVLLIIRLSLRLLLVLPPLTTSWVTFLMPLNTTTDLLPNIELLMFLASLELVRKS